VTVAPYEDETYVRGSFPYSAQAYGSNEFLTLAILRPMVKLGHSPPTIREA
jgi:hypothetical protein